VSSFIEHSERINSIRFASNGRLLTSSSDKTVDSKYVVQSCIKVNGHTVWVIGILPLPSSSNKCVTCSNDKTIKVWDCQAGACLRTLKKRTNWVTTLTVSSENGKFFASGSPDRSVIIWSSETFEVLRRIEFSKAIQSLVFGESGILYTHWGPLQWRHVMQCYHW
jgi:WD40 repeat protein